MKPKSKEFSIFKMVHCMLKFLTLKAKQEEIWSQQATFKQETKTQNKFSGTIGSREG